MSSTLLLPPRAQLCNRSCSNKTHTQWRPTEFHCAACDSLPRQTITAPLGQIACCRRVLKSTQPSEEAQKLRSSLARTMLLQVPSLSVPCVCVCADYPEKLIIWGPKNNYFDCNWGQNIIISCGQIAYPQNSVTRLNINQQIS